ncbi:hypothetical protein JS531_04445 [Bifidobacterium sp. CP2]|uniref:hypothetical protein n=1 Tax=Bifidobacterium sp. CP2 TaxID=2809025 RepID=UPI001BDBFE6F|nr:hypothetical protein [Bifidobacterium sp. CP2]MBT1181233.1 hypothetical protein [Bifidobacterium sp. CP2]
MTTTSRFGNGRRTLAAIASGLCIMALVACSAPFTRNGANDATDGSTAGGASMTRVDETARKFAACLTSKGIEAQTTIAPGVKPNDTSAIRNAVEVRMIDKTGQPIAADDSGMTVTADDDTQKMYANIMYTSIDYGKVWVMFKDSTALTGSPYESKRQAWADCETANPSFAQPAQTTDPGDAFSEEDKQAALRYAKDARAKGFDWVADPLGDEPTTIIIPATVSEADFRRLLKECPTGDLPVTFGFEGTPEEYGYDYTKVMDEAYGVN